MRQLTTLAFDERRHRYTLDDKPIQGVTTIIGNGLPKPGLTWWAAKVVAETAVQEIDRLITDVEYGRSDDAVQWLKQTPFAERDRAAVRGTAVHALAERVANGEEVEVEAEYAPYVTGYVDLLDDLDVTPILTETRLASRTYWYAGTADLIARIGGQTWLLDLKTSKSLHGSYFLQLAAYARADFYVTEDGLEQPMPHVDRIGVIHVTDHGSALHDGPDIDQAHAAFLAVKAVSDIAQTIDGWAPKTKKDHS